MDRRGNRSVGTGKTLHSVDFSNVELRVMADLAKKINIVKKEAIEINKKHLPKFSNYMDKSGEVGNINVLISFVTEEGNVVTETLTVNKGKFRDFERNTRIYNEHVKNTFIKRALEEGIEKPVAIDFIENENYEMKLKKVKTLA